jgi:hypothetical protein
MLADDSHVAAGACQNLSAQVSEPTIAQDDDPIVSRQSELDWNLKSRGHRFGEDRNVSRNRVRHGVQVTLRDGYEVRKSAVMIENSNRRPVRAMSGASRATCLALPAAAIDLSHDPPAGERTVLRDPDEFVAENPAKSHVTSNELQIGFAHARTQHSNECFTGCRRRIGPVGAKDDSITFQDNRAHELNGSL